MEPWAEYLTRRYPWATDMATTVYRFCTFGRWAATGKHPFAEAVVCRLLPRFRDLLHVESMEGVKLELQKEFARITATEAKQSPEQIETAIAVAAEREPFSTRADRRVRYWVDGLVIGSELFVRNTLVHARGRLHQARRQLVRARCEESQPLPLYCFKQLRVLLE